MIRVTVLMAVWKTPCQQLAQAVESILAQSFRDFEFVIVDDGNASPALIGQMRSYASADARVRLLHEPHRGLTSSLNRGLALARGEFLARQDADDWSEPARLERQLAFFAEHPVAVLCGADTWMHQANGRKLWRTCLPQTHARIQRALEGGNPFVHGSTMFRTRSALNAGGYRAELKCSQDYDFFWRLSERGEAANLDEPLYHYRYSAGSVSAGKAEEQALAHEAAQLLAAARRAGRPENVGAALVEAERRLTENAGFYGARLKQADHLMLAGEYRRALSAYAALLARHPASSLAWGKLLRLGVFCSLPLAREACFR